MNLRNAAAFVCGAILLALYGVAWLTSGVALSHEDAANLMAAKSVNFGALPPLFPALLAAFVRVSERGWWLKLLPLGCAMGWFWLLARLLRKMGASAWESAGIAGVAAGAGGVVFAATHLVPQTLFALLATGALLALLDDRGALAGALAGLATLTCPAGMALMAAGMATFAVRRRFRSAMKFAAASMCLVAPWLGFALARETAAVRAATVLTALHASEKAVVLGKNAYEILTAPYVLAGGAMTPYAAGAVGVAMAWALLRRRRLMPDLFVAFYALSLIPVVGTPGEMVAPILPLVLWMLWRGFRGAKRREAVAAGAIVAAGFVAWNSLAAIPGQVRAREWRESEKVYEWIRANTPADATILANLDQAFAAHTGRRTVRGFRADVYTLYYAPTNTAATPDQLLAAVRGEAVDLVAVTPDDDLPESSSFHRSVEALVRGGVLEPVAAPGLARDYRLYRPVAGRR